jgi:ankyrin repeat protein
VKQVIVGCTLAAVCAVACLCLDLYVEYHSPRNQRWQALITDIVHRDARAVEEDLDHGTDPNAYPDDTISGFDEDDVSPLNEAAFDGNVEIVRILLEHHADPNLGDGWNNHPLESAQDHPEVIKLLVRYGAILKKLSPDSAAYSKLKKVGVRE